MFDSQGKDLGYQENEDWWYRGENAFRIAKLDEDYPAHYFTVAGVPPSVISNYFINVLNYFNHISGRKLKSVVEFGSGGGWFLEKFKAFGLENVLGIEGSQAGIDACILRGLKQIDDVCKVDIRRRMPNPIIKFDIALFSEVGEHAEITFHGTVIENLVNYSDLVWFSSEDPEIVKNRGHLHHPGEMPIRYWVNLFAFYGYGCYMLPDEVYEATAGRGRCIFYNKEKYQL